MSTWMNWRRTALSALAVVIVGLAVFAETPAAHAWTTPHIDTVAPTVFNAGEAVGGTITGSGFSDSPGGTWVIIQGGPQQQFTPTDDSTLTFAFAPGAVLPGTYNLVVKINVSGDSVPTPFSNAVQITVNPGPPSPPPGPPVPFVTVNSSADPGVGTCDETECTLREAINAANAHANTTGPDLISFAIAGDGVEAIVLASNLPALTDAVVIDGLTQPGATCAPTRNLLIEIVGNASLTSGLRVELGADGSTVSGLVIGDFPTVPRVGGISVAANGVTIDCNNVGADASGANPRPNGTGIDLRSGAMNNTVSRNVVAFNDGGALQGWGVLAVSSGNRITQNSIFDNLGIGPFPENSGGLGINLGFNFAGGSGNFSYAKVLPGGMLDIRVNTGVSNTTGTPMSFEVFSSPTCDPTGGGEGRTFIGSFPVVVDASGAGSQAGKGRAIFAGIVGPVAPGELLTATLTNETTGTTGPFTRCVIPGAAVTSVLPAAEFSDDGGVPVLITGTGFDMEGMTLGFAPGGIPVVPPLDVVVLSPTSATAVLPPTMAGFVTVSMIRSQAYGGGASGLYDFYVWPRLTGISPAASEANAGQVVQITITGSRFAVAAPANGGVPAIAPARAFVNGTLIPTAPNNTDTQLVATIPASMLQSVGTLRVTVRNPANPFAVSNVLPFFVTQTAATVLDADAATAVAAEEVTVTSTTVAGETIKAATDSGTGTVAVANYGSAPAETGTSFKTANGYFDVYVAPGSTFTETTITYCLIGQADTLYWSPTGEGGFVEVLGVTEVPGEPGETCLQFTVTTTSTPSIADLSGTAFAAAINRVPEIDSVALPSGPVAVGEIASIDVGVSDPDSADLHGLRIDWGDGTVTESQLVAGSLLNASHSYNDAGVYTVAVTVGDGHGGEASTTIQYIVVYDPSAGFVTGGGWITSPAGAYAADPELTGKATFGFVSQYKKGATVPTGNTQFQFHAAGLDFKSTSYEWLVVAGAKAQYKGFGTINGTGNYRFMLTAIDGAQLGGGKPDTFRIRIWDNNSGGLVYDNQHGADENADPTTVLGGGSIVVHKK